MNTPPLGVLIARLDHELTTAGIYAASDNSDAALLHVRRAEQILSQLREAAK